MEWDSGDSSSEGKEAFVASYEEKVAPYLSDDAQGPPRIRLCEGHSAPGTKKQLLGRILWACGHLKLDRASLTPGKPLCQ